MKYLYLFVTIICLSVSCTKETPLIEEDPGIAIALSNLSVSAILAGSSTNEAGHACEPNLVTNTDVALFYDKEGITGDSDMNNADYKINAGTGSAYFHNIKPGSYSILAKNHLGAKVKVKILVTGSNDLMIEF